MFDPSTHPEIGEWCARFGIAEVSYSVCSIDLSTEIRLEGVGLALGMTRSQ